MIDNDLSGSDSDDAIDLSAQLTLDINQKQNKGQNPLDDNDWKYEEVSDDDSDMEFDQGIFQATGVSRQTIKLAQRSALQ